VQHIKHGIDKVLRPHKHKRSFLHGRLFAEWESIVGRKIAKMTQPAKIMHYRNLPGILTLNTTSSSSLYLHMMEEEIIEKINTFFKKDLVETLKYKHVLKIEKPVEKPVEKLLDYNIKKIDKLLEKFEDGDMKNNLEKLGKAIFLKNQKGDVS